MEHLNYCRQLAKHCGEMLAIPSLKPELRAMYGNVLDLHGASTKFMLPNGGRILLDKALRGLDETEPLRLPYPYIALEYECTVMRDEGEPIGHLNGNPVFEQPDFVSAPKRIVFAREREGWIVATIAFWTKHDAHWRVLPECAIPMTGYIERSSSGEALIKWGPMDSRQPASDYMDEVVSLMSFLNVIKCSNVHIERSEPKKSGKKIKAALPFDAYHVLTIDVPGRAGESSDARNNSRSPREHLRRGHIRRLFDGRRIWVNATVVSAGRGAGFIAKDYAVRLSA